MKQRRAVDGVNRVGGSRNVPRKAGPNPIATLVMWGVWVTASPGCDDVRLCQGAMCESTGADSNSSREDASRSSDDYTTTNASSSDESERHTVTKPRPVPTFDGETQASTCDSADEACEGETRFCERWETEADGCVICELGSNQGCGGYLPFCVEVGDPDRDAGMPVQVDCAECLSDEDCGEGAPACVQNRCVECATNEQCGSPEASRCDLASNTCGPCGGVGECAHLEDNPACDVSSGVCVECTFDEGEACGDRVCNVLPGDEGYQTCSDYMKESSSECGECVSDAQCGAALKCVPEINPFFSEERTGKYHCMPFEAELGEEVLCGHHRPFIRTFAATSVGGVSGNFCRPQYATCTALLRYGTLPDIIPDGEPNAGEAACLNRDSCGMPGVWDGLCNGTCTFYCNSQEACPEGSTCAGICLPEY